MTSIGNFAFSGCSSLASVTIPNSVTNIGMGAFYDSAYYNDEANWENGVLYINNALIEAKSDLSGNYSIKDGTVCIGAQALCDCAELTSVIIPNSVIGIGYSAFKGCRNLACVTIPDSVTNIGMDAFYDSAYYNDEANWENGVLYINNALIEAKSDLSGNYSIKDGTVCIGAQAFRDCAELISVIIPNGVIGIGYGAFKGCTDLASMTIPKGVTVIENETFSCCTSLTSITIPNSVTEIGNYAFNDCSDLTSVKIPDGVTSIGGFAFNGCAALTSITVPNSVTSINVYAFYSCDSLADVYYGGSENQWNAISIYERNDCLTSATIHYNSAGFEPGIADVKLTPETDEETGAEIIAVTVETEDIFSNNALVAVGYGEGGVVSVLSVENGEATLPAEGVKTVKVFAWESMESMIPLCEAKEVTVW